VIGASAQVAAEQLVGVSVYNAVPLHGPSVATKVAQVTKFPFNDEQDDLTSHLVPL
jgi:ATP adenylyltransferase/5',5'''-P-1,P-4-tetraphosphate phosphorylase II